MGWFDDFDPIGAIGGAVGGFASPIGGLAGGLLGGSGDFLGDAWGTLTGQKSADAMGRMAEAQLQMAYKIREWQLSDRDSAMKLAEASPAELAALQKQAQINYDAIDQQLQQIQKNQQLIDSADPALREAGLQSYQLMTGKEAQILAPIRQEQGRQREQLKSMLRERLGSDFETSSAGIEALSRFDAQAGLSLQSAQQQALATLLPMAGQSRFQAAAANQNLAVGNSNLAGSIAAGQGALTQRKLAAFQGGTPSNEGLVQNAGAPYVGQLASSEAWRGFMKDAINIGMMAYGGGAGGAAAGNSMAGGGSRMMLPASGGPYNPYPTSNIV